MTRARTRTSPKLKRSRVSSGVGSAGNQSTPSLTQPLNVREQEATKSKTVPRRRWKQIVDNYIKSPHAESMRKRNW